MSLRAGFTLGSWRIYPLEGRLVGEHHDHRIQPKTMDVLVCLAEASGEVVERDELLEKVWRGRAQTDEPLTRRIGELRKALGDTRSEPSYIATIPKRGYQLLQPAIAIEQSMPVDSKTGGPALSDTQKTKRLATAKKLAAGFAVLLIAAVVQVFVERTFEDITDNEVTATATRQANVSPKSVAVLNFADLSQDQDQSWFANGLAEEVLNALTHTPDLLVLSRTSSDTYRNTNKDASTIARELGVAHVLQGSVRRVGERLRVNAQLVRATDGFHVWSQNYDRDAAGVIDIQEDLALQIATALETTMDPDALADMVRVGTSSVEAYSDYIRGVAATIQALGAFSTSQVLEANAFFEGARQADPEFSAAHRHAADFWIYQLSPADARAGLSDLAPEEMLSEFLTRINLAIEFAKNDVDRKALMAKKAQVELRLRDAIGYYKEYLAERPNDLLAWQDLLRSAMYASDRDTVLSVLKHYESIGESNVQAAIYYMGNAYKWIDPSITADFGIEAMARWPNNNALRYQTHRSLVWALRVEEAAELAALYSPESSSAQVLLARQACAEGRRDDVLQMLDARRAAGTQADFTDYFMYRFLSDNEKAYEVLRQYESEEVPYKLATWLHYTIVDTTPFPSLTKILERENVDRPAPPAIPFACPAV